MERALTKAALCLLVLASSSCRKTGDADSPDWSPGQSAFRGRALVSEVLQDLDDPIRRIIGA
jgi:hypothetical protein